MIGGNHRATQLWLTWSGVPFIVLWLVGFVFFAHFIPPPSPTDSLTQTVSIYQENTVGIRFGLFLTLYAAVLYVSWSAAISALLKRIPKVHPVLADLQLLLGGLLCIGFLVPAMLFEAAAFRPDRDPAAIQLLHDLSWLMFVAMGAPAMLQAVVVGTSILRDDSANPLFARWVGYFNIWTGILFVPGPMCVFFKTGPFAWPGLFAWWIPLVAFVVWMVVMMAVMHRAIVGQRTGTVTEDTSGRDLDERMNLLESKLDILGRNLTEETR